MEEQDEEFTDAQIRVIGEIRRIAAKLNLDRLSSNDFDKHHELAGVSTAGYQYGSWNRAVRAAGLQPYECGKSNTGPKIADDELLPEIIRVHGELGKAPSEREISRFGKYGIRPYKACWGSLSTACEIAYEKFGIPAG